jgi:hypothetical protein
LLSLGNQLIHIGTSYNYTLDPTQLRPPLARPENWAVLARAVFPNAANWSAFILPLAAVSALFFLARWRADFRGFVR